MQRESGPRARSAAPSARGIEPEEAREGRAEGRAWGCHGIEAGGLLSIVPLLE
jgi:hypothetical protein